MNEKINSGEIPLKPLEVIGLGVQLLKNNVTIFSNRSAYDLVSGYQDFVTETISKRKPGFLRNDTFSLLNGVIK